MKKARTGSFYKSLPVGSRRPRPWRGWEPQTSQPWGDRIRDETNKGDAHYQWQLGMAYEKALYGLKQSHCKAVEWYRKSAKQGHPMAEGKLGYYYFVGGGGVSIDDRRAFLLYQRAAEHGEVRSMRGLGECYCEGYGTEKNLPKGLEWIRRAIEMGDQRAKVGLCKYDSQSSVLDVIAANYGLTDVTAMCKVGLFYDFGEAGLEKNCKAAMGWYERAAQLGDAMAQWNLFLSCEAEHKSPEFPFPGLDWVSKSSAHLGYWKAQEYLGWASQTGNGLKKDQKEAYKWYKRAARQGAVVSQHNLGVLCRDEFHDIKTATRMFTKAAKQGYGEAQYALYCLLYASAPSTAYSW